MEEKQQNRTEHTARKTQKELQNSEQKKFWKKDLLERVEVGHAEHGGDEGADRCPGSDRRMDKTIPLTTSSPLIYTLPPSSIPLPISSLPANQPRPQP